MRNGVRSKRDVYQRPSNSWDYHVEMLVVADAKMYRKHRGADRLTDYVLTLFATVRSIYRHASLEAAISIDVVRLVIFRDEYVRICVFFCLALHYLRRRGHASVSALKIHYANSVGGKWRTTIQARTVHTITMWPFCLQG